MDNKANFSLFLNFTNSHVFNGNITAMPQNGNFTMTMPVFHNGTTERVKMASIQSEPMYKLAVSLLMWLLPVIIAIGTIGNIFSFLVMLQREMRQTSTFFYLACLAVADSIVLFMSAFKTWIRLCSGIEMLHISGFTCKLFTFFTYLSLHLSAWLIVAVTVERFIVVWFPLKAPSLCSTKRAKLTTLTIAVVFFLLNVHLFWTAELRTDAASGRSQCAMSDKHTFLYKKLLPWVHLTLYSFLPFVSLLVFNILIILSLVKHRQIIASRITKADRRTRYNHRRLAITLLSVSFVWIITTTPSALYTVLPLNPKSVSQGAKYFLIKVVCYIFLYINHSINFFLYCITGQSFRRHFIKLVCRTCRRKRKPKPRLMFRTSRSNSRQEGSFPLMNHSGSKTNTDSRYLHSQLLAINELPMTIFP